MPQRTINDAVFAYYDENGRYLTARRGETVEIPEGPDIERGDKFGAFTAVVGEEPPPPAESSIPDIEADWTQEEFVRFVDAGHSDEILTKLAEVAEEDQARIAQLLIEAENGRGKGARKSLLKKLAKVSGSPVVPDVTTEVADLDPELVAYVEANNVEAVLARAEADPELADGLLAAELAQDRPRKGITDVLGKTEA